MSVIEASVWFEFGNLNTTPLCLFVPKEEVFGSSDFYSALGLALSYFTSIIQKHMMKYAYGMRQTFPRVLIRIHLICQPLTFGLHFHVTLNSRGFKPKAVYGRRVFLRGWRSHLSFMQSLESFRFLLQKGVFSFTHTMPLLLSIVSVDLTFSWIVLFSGATGKEIPELISTRDLALVSGIVAFPDLYPVPMKFFR